MKFSLVVATYGLNKLRDLGLFLTSLSAQRYKNFEVIIVDQNRTNDIEKLLIAFNGLDIIHLKCEPRGLSFARNVGIDSVTGDVLSFPDDDCLYPPDILKQIVSFFEVHNKYDLISVSCRDTVSQNRLAFVNRTKDGVILFRHIFFSISSISFFVKWNKEEPTRFDTRFGIGGKYNSSEELDFVASYLEDNRRGYYKDDHLVLHPDNFGLKNKKLFDKVSRNSQGHGAFFGKHHSKNVLVVFEHLILRPLVGFFLYLLTFNFVKAKISMLSLYGRVYGFLRYVNDHTR